MSTARRTGREPAIARPSLTKYVETPPTARQINATRISRGLFFDKSARGSVMPPEMAVSMRHTKLKAEEAALIAGELTKPSWESRNEGIHERVSFEDTIWGFDLAGGAYYKTPLRVTYVKPDSRAEKAGIRPGDRLLRINGVETSSLTIQEAHDLILKAGIHLQLNVTAPEDVTDAYYCYEDPIVDEYEAELERLRAEEAARRRQVHARVSSYWSLQWPWVSKRRIIWRESNCFMVPSKYEEKHRDKFPTQPMLRKEDDLVLDNVKNSRHRDNPPKFVRSKSYEGITVDENAATNGEGDEDEPKLNGQENGNHEESLQNGVHESGDSDIEDNSVIENNYVGNDDDSTHTEGDTNDMGTRDKESIAEDSDVNIEEINDENGHIVQDTNNHEISRNDFEESNNIRENGDLESINHSDNIIEEVLHEGDGVSKSADDDIIDSVLNGNGHSTDSSETANER